MTVYSKNSKYLLNLFLVLALMSLSACASGRLYQWGSYESSLYRMYGTPDSFDLEREIANLSAEVERAVERDQAIPPGKIAHLGYLYYQLGDNPLARSSFETEKRLYPESAQLMDRFIGQLK